MTSEPDTAAEKLILIDGFGQLTPKQAADSVRRWHREQAEAVSECGWSSVIRLAGLIRGAALALEKHERETEKEATR